MNQTACETCTTHGKEYCNIHYDDNRLPDSGKRVEYPGGAKRERARISRFDLLPPFAIRALAEHYGLGALKYSARNWERGLPLDDFLDSALSHIFSYMSTDRTEPHLEAAVWNLVGYIEGRERIRTGEWSIDFRGDIEARADWPKERPSDKSDH